MTADDHIRAHKASIRHRDQLLASQACGCFHCLATFEAPAIKEWVDDGQTALCPRCGVDSVIGTASGYPVDPGFLRRMQQHWCSEDGGANEDMMDDEDP